MSVFIIQLQLFSVVFPRLMSALMQTSLLADNLPTPIKQPSLPTQVGSPSIEGRAFVPKFKPLSDLLMKY